MRLTTGLGDFPHDAAAASGRVFVGAEGETSVSVLERGRTIRRLSVARQPGGIAPADGGRAIAVVSVRERVLELFDAVSLRRLAAEPAGVGPTHVVADGERVYVVDTTGEAVLVFRLRPRLQLTRRVTLHGSPYGIAIDRRRERLWVTLTRSNRVAALATGGRARLLRRLSTVRQPNTVAVDERSGRVFVAGRSAGVLQLLDP